MKQTPIYFENSFDKLNSYLKENQTPGVYILVDSNTHELCLPKFMAGIITDLPIEIIEFPAGEEQKIPAIVQNIWRTLADFGVTRNSLLINLGGGVVTDLGGFVASTFKRGINFINVPTTLLGMVDASIGGKTGVDINNIKNAVGTFSFPKMTLIMPEFIETLPWIEIKSGLAEMLKHGLIYDAEHWKNLINIPEYNAGTLTPYIRDSLNIKIEIVEKDPFELGLRKILNFGHTIGHALETEYLGSDKSLTHGEAVAIGMMVETILSYENELISKEEMEEIFGTLLKIYGKSPIDENVIDSLLFWMGNDKKNSNEKINFSLIHNIGNCKYNVFLNGNQVIQGILKYNHKLETFPS